MASPGPRRRDWNDDISDEDETSPRFEPSVEENDSEPEEAPRPLAGRRHVNVVVLNSDDSDNESENPSNSGRQQPRGRRGGRLGNTAVTDPTPAAPPARKGKNKAAYVEDDAGFEWADETVIARERAPDGKYFWGRHVQSGSWKCRLCSEIYASGNSGTTLRGHIKRAHATEFLAEIRARGWETKLPASLLTALEGSGQDSVEGRTRVPFSTQELLNQLVRVIVANDLSINLVENRDFRDLLLLLRESLHEKDIPHRTKLRSVIIDQWKEYYNALKQELHGALGKISFTADMWSSKGMNPYLALTAHWLSRNAETGQVTLRQALLAFRRVRGGHSGARIARIVFHILESAEILHKIGHFTMDNASSNITFMVHLETELHAIGVDDFDAKKNFIRCFSHIINLCAQAVIKKMEKADTTEDYSDTETEPATPTDYSDDGQLDFLRPVRTKRKSGPIHRARKTVGFIRKSGLRRDLLMEIVADGNVKQLWMEQRVVGDRIEKVVIVLKPVILLPDVKTRWDSLFYMLRRLRYLREPLTQFMVMDRDGRNFRHQLQSQHWDRLELLELILQQPHIVQTAMAVENTPMLAATIPAFELFVSSWKAMQDDQDLVNANIVTLIKPGLELANKYYSKLGETDAYVISMFINPSVRFEWIRKNWDPELQTKARQMVLDKLREYQEDDASTRNGPARSGSRNSSGSHQASRQPSRQPSRARSTATPAPIAANTIVRTLDRYRTTSTSLDFSAVAGRTSSGQWSVEEEMNDYISSSIPPRSSTDMIGYWTNHGSKTWKTIYQLFLDYAPIQATSVPSERVFSSSAQTDTKRRNRISPLLMEALQMLKFNFKKTRLNFMSEWQCAPIPDAEEDWLRKLGSETDAEQQKSLHREIWDDWDLLDRQYFEMPEDVGA